MNKPLEKIPAPAPESREEELLKTIDAQKRAETKLLQAEVDVVEDLPELAKIDMGLRKVPELLEALPREFQHAELEESQKDVDALSKKLKDISPEELQAVRSFFEISLDKDQAAKRLPADVRDIVDNIWPFILPKYVSELAIKEIIEEGIKAKAGNGFLKSIGEKGGSMVGVTVTDKFDTRILRQTEEVFELIKIRLATLTPAERQKRLEFKKEFGQAELAFLLDVNPNQMMNFFWVGFIEESRKETKSKEAFTAETAREKFIEAGYGDQEANVLGQLFVGHDSGDPMNMLMVLRGEIPHLVPGDDAAEARKELEKKVEESLEELQEQRDVQEQAEKAKEAVEVEQRSIKNPAEKIKEHKEDFRAFFKDVSEIIEQRTDAFLKSTDRPTSVSARMTEEAEFLNDLKARLMELPDSAKELLNENALESLLRYFSISLQIAQMKKIQEEVENRIGGTKDEPLTGMKDDESYQVVEDGAYIWVRGKKTRPQVDMQHDVTLKQMADDMSKKIAELGNERMGIQGAIDKLFASFGSDSAKKEKAA